MTKPKKKTPKKGPEAAAIWVSIKDLAPWADNPRLNEGAVDTVAESIRRFGFSSPIIARTEDSMGIAGHTRLKAALKLGLDKVPVRYMDLDPTDARLLALADNRVAEIADWDQEQLAEVFRSLDEGVELGGLGFDSDELERLLEPPDYEASEGEELDADSFDNFNNTCPRCNFEWSDV